MNWCASKVKFSGKRQPGMINCWASYFLIHGFTAPKIDRIESTLEYPIGSNVKNYPYELIDRLVAQQGYANLFDSYPEDEEVDDFTFHNRMSFSDDDFEDICESQKPDKYPQHGLTMDNKNVTIVNTKNFTQRVEMEVCRQVWFPLFIYF